MKKVTSLFLTAILGMGYTYAQELIPSPSDFQGERQQRVKERAGENGSQQLLFGYDNGEIVSTFGSYSGMNMSALIEIPAENSDVWKGNKVVGIRIGLGNTMVSQGSIILTRVLSTNDADETQKPLHSQTVRLKSGWQTLMFDEPWVIDGEKFYAGYTFRTVSTTDYPIATDGRKNNGHLGGHVGANGSWTNVTEAYGNLCIQIILEGDNLPQNDLLLDNFNLWPYYSANDPFYLSAKITNKGTKTINTVNVECTIGGEKIEFDKYTMQPSAIAPGETGILKVEGLRYTTETSSTMVMLNVTEVNGEKDATPGDNKVSGECAFAPAVFPRAFVMEEWTGTWCPNCVNGIITMEHMNRYYKDENFIGIAVHYNDQMQPAGFGYNGFLNLYGGSYPGCIINRKENLYPKKETIDALYQDYRYVPTVYDIKAQAIYDEAAMPDKVVVMTQLTSSIDIPQGFYAIALAVLEDNVGPYRQQNAFAGSSGDYDGWEDKGSYVSMEFMDVAREIDNWKGISTGVPRKFDKMVAYDYSGTVSVRNVSKMKNASVVVLLIDSRTSEILNARKVPIVTGTIQSGVDEVAGNKGTFRIEGRTLLTAGDFNYCEVTSVDGKSVNKISSGQSLNLEQGIYIIRMINSDNTSSTTKVIIR